MMKRFNQKVYRFFWGVERGERAEATQRDLNEGIAINMGWLVGLSIVGWLVITVAQRFDAQWAREAWLAQLVFILVIVLPLLNPQTRRILYVRRKPCAEDYPAYMAEVRKRILRGTPFFAVMAGLAMSMSDGWLFWLTRVLITTVLFACAAYLIEYMRAQQALAKEGKNNKE